LGPEPGVLLVDKPAGVTSHVVVAQVRRDRGAKTGNAGTLDPFATGLLPPASLELPTGELRQRPPAYSAIKLGGERAYARARRGEELVMPERFVTVHRFEELGREGDRAEFEIECSSGTYVRSLIADLGDAYCLELRRTAIGPFSVSEAEADLPLGEALARLT
jgi:tRNA pseudouridine55 synthase